MREPRWFLWYRRAGKKDPDDWITYYFQDTGRAATNNVMHAHCIAAKLRTEGNDVLLWTSTRGINDVCLPAIDPTENP